ncbi:MAG: bifunctional metallophosphatase/5'-nucleotidase [Fidelibacterota bacterium]
MTNKRMLFTLLLAVFATVSCGDKIVDAEIIHWNDFHSANLPYTPTHYNPEKIQVGGYAVMAGYIDSLRNIYDDALVLHAGDDFQGSPVSSITKGMSQIMILNKIKPDAFTIGNHEFDYSKENLYKALDKADFPVVSANIYDEVKNQLFTEPYKIYQKDDVAIGVIGVVYKNLKSSVIPANVEGLEILDPVTEIQKYVDEIKSKVDLIVVLSHSGFHSDSLYAENLEEVDVIVGGHSHSWLSKPAKVNDILILQAGGRGERLGLLKMKVNRKTNAIESYDYDFIRTEVKKVTPNPEVAQLVDSLESKIRETMDQQIGTLKKDWLRTSRDESNIGNWICDVTRQKFDVDIALQNSGGIRKNLPAGPIKVRDIWEISPFDNSIQIFHLSGKELLDMINYRLENPRDLLQVSGMKIYYDGKTGKLVKLTVGGQPVDPGKSYSIATNNYIMSHSQRFFGIDPETLDIEETNYLGRDVLLEALEKNPVVSGEKEDRIIDVR